MRWTVLIAALAMQAIAWASQRGLLGPTNGAVSDRYPTLLVATGGAFAIWGLIFLLDLVFALWQAVGRQRDAPALVRVRPAVAGGLALTGSWMVVFSQQWFWLALAIIWAALACLLWAAVQLRDASALGRWAAVPLALHAGWLSLAVFLNTAQVIVAHRLLPTDAMLGWSLVLWGLAAALLLAANGRLRGSAPYVAAALWGLGGVWIKQSASPLPGAAVAAWAALLAAAALAVQQGWLHRRRWLHR